MLERIIGNSGTVQSLKAALSEKRLAHSILLVGEEGCGAGFAARCLAADRLYPGGGAAAEALVRGETSRAVSDKDAGDGHIETGTVREVIGLRGEGLSGFIKVGAVRALRAEMFNTALSGEGRAAIIYGAQNFNESSANALLKILEEPPENTLFILTAGNAAAILPTIRSRCAQYTMAPVPEEQCADYVRRHCPGCGDPERLASAFGGCIGRCVKACTDENLAPLLQLAEQLVADLSEKNLYNLLVHLSACEKDRLQARQVLDYFCCLCGAALQHPDRYGLGPQQAMKALRCARDLQDRLAANGNTRLNLTLFGARLDEELGL